MATRGGSKHHSGKPEQWRQWGVRAPQGTVSEEDEENDEENREPGEEEKTEADEETRSAS